MIVVHPSVTMTMKELKKETSSENAHRKNTHIKLRAVEKVVGYDHKGGLLVTVSNNFRFISPNQKQ